jgi:RNA polymerase sigma-70 factor (ECF subfamily)
MGVLRIGSRQIEHLDFEAFWFRERDRLDRALTLTLGDPVLAAEAVDEAMARALERWHVVGRYERPAGWVYRVALNWARSWLRKWNRRPTRPASQLDRPSLDDLPDPDLAGPLAALRVEERTAVVLRFYLQFTPTEIAEVMNIPTGTAKSHVHRGLANLRSLMEVRP